jgi:hypothetical protein
LRNPERAAARRPVQVAEVAEAAVVLVVAADMPFLAEAEAAVAEAACDPSAAAGDRQYPADGRQTLGP